MIDACKRALVVACLAALALGGCSKSTTVSSSQGSVTTQQGAGGDTTTTIKGKDGQVSIGKTAVDPASLGLPVYPGATASDSGVSVSGASAGANAQIAVLSTGDSFDKVYDYYKGQMPAGSQKSKVDANDTQMAVFQEGEDSSGDQKSVIISSSKGKTTIELAHATKK